MAAPTVAVVGLKALNRDVGRLVADRGPLDKVMSQAGRQAAQPVADITRSALPQVTGRLASDVRVSATRSGAAVRMGRASIRYAGWVEFGGNRRSPHDSYRDYNPRGRYLFPAALQMASTSARLYSDALTKGLANYDWTNSGEAVHD